jgi:hypothetical protein
MNPIDAFRGAMRQFGIEYAGQIEADGKLRRFRAGDDKAKNSWYVLFSGPPRTIKLSDGHTAKGYHREDFREAFARYLPSPPLPNRNPVTTRENTDVSSCPETSPEENELRFETAEKINKDGHGYGVTVGRAGISDEVLL